MKQTLPMIKILGIDPGYDRVGWAIIEENAGKPKFSAAGLIQTNAKETTIQRYQQIISDIQLLVNDYRPQVVAIEELFFSTNRKTALRVSEARGIITAAVLQADGLLPTARIIELHPQTIKLNITGNGKADKQAMAKQLHLELSLPADLNDDALDAVAIAITALYSQKQWYSHQ